jgi:hypothetical protein
MTNMKEYNQDIPRIFSSLPIQNIVEQVELKYGVNIDTNLFGNNKKNISQIKSYNTASGGMMPNYFVEYDTDASQRVSIFFGKFYQEEKLVIHVTLSLYEGDKQVAENKLSVSVPEWSPY